jgi:protoporphyrinogen oxidase
MAGLSAAWHLDGRDVLLLESSERVGGRVKSESRGDYWANLGAQFVAPQGALGRIAALPGIDLLPATGHPHLSVNGHLTKAAPTSLMLGRGLPLSARTGLASFSLRCDRDFRKMNVPGDSGRAFRRQLDAQTAAQLFGANAQTRPILEAISGAHATAYFHFAMAVGAAMSDYSWARFGSETLITALRAALSQSTRVETGAAVRRVTPRGDHVELEYEQGGVTHTVTAKRCVMAAPAYVASDIVEGLPAEYADALNAVRVGTYLCAGVFTTEGSSKSYDHIPNMTIVGRSFQALFNPVSGLRHGPRKPGGALSIYAGGRPAKELIDATDAEVAAAFTRDLCEILPLDPSEIGEVVIQRWPKAMPYWGGGKFVSVEALRRPVAGIHFAGDYLSRPAMTTAADAGAMAATAVDEALGSA